MSFLLFFTHCIDHSQVLDAPVEEKDDFPYCLVFYEDSESACELMVAAVLLDVTSYHGDYLKLNYM